MENSSIKYPVGLSIDYPDRPMDRLTSFFRIFTTIPIGIIACVMMQTLPFAQSNVTYNTDEQEIAYYFTRFVDSGIDVSDIVLIAVIGVLLLPVLLFLAGFITNLFNPIVMMIAFRSKYPRWWFDYYTNLLRFLTRVGSYFMLISDVYPSTDEEQNVHMDIPYPEVGKDVMPGMSLIKWFLAIPHYIAIAILTVAACVCYVIIWFAILFSGKVPRDMFNFVVGYFRWIFRVEAYAYFHFTDRYPPFSIN